ncbi:phosphatase PAP2 family protein [Candidatus Parcubacteria bacterium]|nr:phosphatase PAP2 family protein [Candidatus Parcubacteria bacterium]
MGLNQYLFSYLYGLSHRNELFDAFAIFFSNDFGLIALFGLLYFLYTHESPRRGLRELLVVTGSGVSAWAIAHFVKYVYPVGRPEKLYEAIMPLVAHGNGMDAFPSGHATFYAGLAAAIWGYHRNLGIFFTVVALFVGLARIMVGIHTPLDIVAGYVLGVAVALLVRVFARKRSL